MWRGFICSLYVVTYFEFLNRNLVMGSPSSLMIASLVGSMTLYHNAAQNHSLTSNAHNSPILVNPR